MQIPTDLTDPDSHFKSTRSRKSFNATKTAVLYDLVDPTIAIADRNFECCDTMANLDRRGLKYRLRAREHKGIASGLDPPGTEEFDMTEDTYEIPIINLNPEEFPLAALKKLYARSWGAETPFRELKHAVELLYFHSKKVGSSSKRFVRGRRCTISSRYHRPRSGT